MKLRMPEMPSATLLAALDSYNLLPAIVFMPTRRRCDQAASEAALTRRDPNERRREERRDFMRSFVEQNPEVRGHRHWDTIIRGGVASHHAGHIPAWKLVIEKLMSAGLLDAIFATATVAAGVDFPARSVVLTGADFIVNKGYGNNFHGRVASTGEAVFYIIPDYFDSDQFPIAERFGDTALLVRGEVSANATPELISGTLAGEILIAQGASPPFDSYSSRCPVARFEMVRR